MIDRTYRTSTELTAEIRGDLKQAFPECKFSVTKKSYSGGRSITVALMAAPFQPLISYLDTTGLEPGESPIPSHYQVNEYTLGEDDADYYRQGDNFVNNGILITPKARALLRQVRKIANKRNWDNSNSQIDYFDVNFYLHMEVGAGYNKPFVCTAPRTQA